MAKYEDYLPGGSKYTGPEVTGVDAEIEAAKDQQEERKTSTPEVDWEKRYKDLEVAYSRQGQQMGDYRGLIDNFVSTTPDEPVVPVETAPITPDDIYENPDEAVRRAVDSHPAIIEAQALKAELAENAVVAKRNDFVSKHPDFQETVVTDEFGSWVREDATRYELAQRADAYDMTAADALFTLWEASQTPAIDPANSVENLALESGSGAEHVAPDRFSRREMLAQKIRAKQGDPAAEAYVKANGAAYRIALGEGNVRD